MSYQILYCSKYGSTKLISQWIEQKIKLSKKEVTISDTKSCKSTSCDTLILGTPIYGGRAIQDFYDFLENDLSKFDFKRLIIFVVVLQKSFCFDENHDLQILQNYPDVKKSAQIQEAILGEMIYDNLDSQDKGSLDGFYNQMKLSKEKIKQKHQPKTLLNKKEVWEFADKILGEENE